MQATMGAPHHTRHRADFPQGACRAVKQPLTPPCGGRHSHAPASASRVDRTCAHTAATPPRSGRPPSLRACRGGVRTPRCRTCHAADPRPGPPPCQAAGRAGLVHGPPSQARTRGVHARRDQNRRPQLTAALVSSDKSTSPTAVFPVRSDVAGHLPRRETPVADIVQMHGFCHESISR